MEGEECALCINNLVAEIFRLSAKRKSSGSERDGGRRGVGSGRGATGNEGRESKCGSGRGGAEAMKRGTVKGRGAVGGGGIGAVGGRGEGQYVGGAGAAAM